MLAQKTASLYRFAAQAGAMIGRGRPDFDDEAVTALGEFAFRTGIAFQLHDDILGLLGKGADLGKPVGSDLREGKRTAIIRYAWDCAGDAERGLLAAVLGNPTATAEATAEVTALLDRVGAIDYARELADGHYQAGLAQLDRLPAGPYRDLLRALAQAMVKRSR
jgi:geranylgeranyl diphosphate synthase type I